MRRLNSYAEKPPRWTWRDGESVATSSHQVPVTLFLRSMHTARTSHARLRLRQEQEQELVRTTFLCWPLYQSVPPCCTRHEMREFGKVTSLAAVQNSIIGPSSPVDDGCALHVRRGPATVAAGVFSGGGRSMTLVRFGRRVFPRRLCFALLPSARALQAPPGRRCTAANASPVACRTGGAVLHVRRQCG